jgi:hypothetical protein
VTISLYSKYVLSQYKHKISWTGNFCTREPDLEFYPEFPVLVIFATPTPEFYNFKEGVIVDSMFYTAYNFYRLQY